MFIILEADMKKSKESSDICDGNHEHSIDYVKQTVPSLDTLFNLAELFKMFGDSTRIRIMCALFAKELCVCDIAALLDMGQSAISHQLRLLRSSGLVKVRRDGKQSYYSLADDHVREIYHMGLEHILEKN